MSNFLAEMPKVISLGNPIKDRQRFVDTIVLISAADWPKQLSNLENVVQTPFGRIGLRTLNNAKFCQTVRDTKVKRSPLVYYDSCGCVVKASHKKFSSTELK